MPLFGQRHDMEQPYFQPHLPHVSSIFLALEEAVIEERLRAIEIAGFRSVSTIVRQVASEFSVDFPLSRWPVWVG
jgi:hypothetical protein